MPRVGVDYETVKHAAVKLLSQGTAPSVQKIREVLGTGSNSTIAEHLKKWRDEYAKKAIHHLPANMPTELISAFEVLWQSAMEQAQGQLAEYKHTIDDEHEKMVQIKRDDEKVIADLKGKLAETAAKLEQAINEKQKVVVELAVENDRLVKQENTLYTQKVQYEERLKRIYDEKDVITAQFQQVQMEIKVLQEKLEQQTEQHQNMLTQQNSLHEQSENRWLRLIDQARQETKETHKKLEIVNKQSNEQITKLTATLSDLQQTLFEKTTHLKLANEQVSQLKDEIKISQKENIQMNSVIMKYEDEKRLKALALAKSKSKNEIECIS
jgi:chromosome segregation ATPase